MEEFPLNQTPLLFPIVLRTRNTRMDVCEVLTSDDSTSNCDLLIFLDKLIQVLN